MLSGARKWACAAIGLGPGRALSACRRIRVPDLTYPAMQARRFEAQLSMPPDTAPGAGVF
jgi:hypothetical protein